MFKVVITDYGAAAGPVVDIYRTADKYAAIGYVAATYGSRGGDLRANMIESMEAEETIVESLGMNETIRFERN